MATTPFRAGFLLFPRLTQLDMTGPFEVLRNLPGAEVHLIWKNREPVTAEGGLAIVPTATFADCPPLDLICVPGGTGINALLTDRETLDFLRRVAPSARYVTSVCTGALVLGAAGLLRGKRATTHWTALELLREFGAEPVEARVVIDGNVITGGGVTAGIDFALTVVSEIAGQRAAEAIQLGIEYAPASPFNAGSCASAPPAARASVSPRSRPPPPRSTRCGDPRRTLAAELLAAQIEMQVVVVVAVVIGGQHDVEALAGALGERVEEQGLRAGPAPVALDVDDRMVGQVEAEHVDGAAVRVLGEILAAADLAARIGAGMIDPRHRLLEVALGQRLDPLIFEVREGDRELAAERGRPIEIDALGRDLDPVGEAAALRGGEGRHLLELDAELVEIAEALLIGRQLAGARRGHGDLLRLGRRLDERAARHRQENQPNPRAHDQPPDPTEPRYCTKLWLRWH